MIEFLCKEYLIKRINNLAIINNIYIGYSYFELRFYKLVFFKFDDDI